MFWNVSAVILSLLFASRKNKKLVETTLRGLVYYLWEDSKLNIRQEFTTKCEKEGLFSMNEWRGHVSHALPTILS